MAGCYALRFFYQALFDAVTKILPYGSNISSQLFDNMFSLLSPDGRDLSSLVNDGCQGTLCVGALLRDESAKTVSSHVLCLRQDAIDNGGSV